MVYTVEVFLYRITESIMLRKTPKIIRYNLRPNTMVSTRLWHRVSRLLLNISWHGDFHLPGQPVPISNHPLCEEILPDVQPKTLLLQLIFTPLRARSKLWSSCLVLREAEIATIWGKPRGEPARMRQRCLPGCSEEEGSPSCVRS